MKHLIYFIGLIASFAGIAHACALGTFGNIMHAIGVPLLVYFWYDDIKDTMRIAALEREVEDLEAALVHQEHLELEREREERLAGIVQQ